MSGSFSAICNTVSKCNLIISINDRQSYEEEIEDQSRRKASIARRKSSILNTDEVNEEVIDDNAYDYGDDDFEDYDDDDFEEDDGDEDEGGKELNLTNEELEGVDEIRKAIREENQLAESHNSSRSSSRVCSDPLFSV